MKVLEVILIYILLKMLNAQFLEQPDPGTVFSPVQDQVTLICSVEEGYGVDWHVAIVNATPQSATNYFFHYGLMQLNFSLVGLLTNRSTLSLALGETRTHTNNGTNITCLAQAVSTQDITVQGNTVQIIFYDTPPPPTDLSVDKNKLGFLNISWSLGFIEGVPVNYTLAVLNLNTTIAGLLDQHYVFETSRPCDVYSFTVTAVTAAGNSMLSQELFITRNLNSYGMCTITTISETTSYESPMTTSDQLPNMPSSEFQENFAITLNITLSAIIAVLMAILVLLAVIVCATCYCCHKKTKPLATSDLAEPLAEPVYEIPGKVLPSSSDRAKEVPLTVTLSSAYGVSTDYALPDITSLGNNNPPFVMKPSPAYGVSMHHHKPSRLSSGVK